MLGAIERAVGVCLRVASQLSRPAGTLYYLRSDAEHNLAKLNIGLGQSDYEALLGDQLVNLNRRIDWFIDAEEFSNLLDYETPAEMDRIRWVDEHGTTRLFEIASVLPDAPYRYHSRYNHRWRIHTKLIDVKRD